MTASAAKPKNSGFDALEIDESIRLDQTLRFYRKAVKAAIVLLPLLGITNALVMIDAPLHRSPLEFAIWSYSSHFLTSFQGFFVALIYCFLNGEVA